MPIVSKKEKNSRASSNTSSFVTSKIKGKVFSSAKKSFGNATKKVAISGFGTATKAILGLSLVIVCMFSALFSGDKKDDTPDIYDICLNYEEITDEYKEMGDEWIENCREEIHEMISDSAFDISEENKNNPDVLNTVRLKKDVGAAFLFTYWSVNGKSVFTFKNANGGTEVPNEMEIDWSSFIENLSGTDFTVEEYDYNTDSTFENLKNYFMLSRIDEDIKQNVISVAKIAEERKYYVSGASIISSDDIQWPVAETAVYSTDYTSFADGSDRYPGVWHLGFDFGVHAGTPVYAVFDGSFSTNGIYNDNGWACVVSDDLRGIHGELLKAYYNHLQSYAVSNGQHVKKGDLIGFSGIAASVQHLCFKITETTESVNDRRGYSNAAYFYPFSYFGLKDPQPLCRDKGESNGCVPESYLNLGENSIY